MLNSFGEAEEQPAAESSTEEGESSDVNFEVYPDESLEKKAQLGVEYLNSKTKPRVLHGFTSLIRCASSPGGPLAVLNAKFIQPPPAPPTPPLKAIPTALDLAKTEEPQYCKLAVCTILNSILCRSDSFNYDAFISFRCPCLTR